MLELIKFVIFSRVPKRSIVFYISFAILFGYIGYISYYEAPYYVNEEFRYLSVFYLTMMIAVSPFNTRFGLASKSDNDFLALLPFDDDKIIASLILGSFIVNVIFLSIFMYWFIEALGIAGATIIPAFALLSSSLPAVLYNLNNRRKILIDLVIVTWFISAIFNFQLSPLSMFYGYFEGYVISYAFAFVTFSIALKKFNFSSYSNFTVSSEKGEVKEEISFKSSNPLVLTLTRNLRILEVGGRVNWMGVSTFVSRRVELWKVMLGSSISAIVLYFILSRINDGSFLVFYVLFGGWFFMIMIASAAFITEPIWLDMNVMTPEEFARYYLTSKALSIAIILSPFAILSLILGYLGKALGFIVFIPLSSIFIMSLYARYYQQRYNMPINVSPIRLLVSLLTSIPLIPLIILSFLPAYLILCLPIMFSFIVFYLTISMPFIFSKSYWESTIEKIVTSVT
ncbi:MAG: hypothetical protein RXQ99_08050 [Acidianus sp.]|uniref:hypothetical protein n=1 Tax=Acidianus sp. TaxID=1872104 RepID=UPI00397B2B6F